MLSVQDLPTVNATLNAMATVLLIAGWILVRRGNKRAHRAVMIAALVCSAGFLTSYLVYHYQVGSVRFQGTGLVRAVYFTVLISHTLLAIAVPILATITVVRAVKGKFKKHRAIGRWTLPIWLYVSVTGVVVYWMLYRMGF